MAKKKKFYKKAKPKTEKNKLPSNYRIFTEKIHSDHTIFFIGLICMIVAIVVVSIDLYSNYQMKLGYERDKKESVEKISFWQNQVKNKPSYRDGYFSLALIYYQIKDFRNSSENLEKAMEIDPNFEKGKELEEVLKKY